MEGGVAGKKKKKVTTGRKDPRVAKNWGDALRKESSRPARRRIRAPGLSRSRLRRLVTGHAADGGDARLFDHRVRNAARRHRDPDRRPLQSRKNELPQDEVHFYASALPL